MAQHGTRYECGADNCAEKGARCGPGRTRSLDLACDELTDDGPRQRQSEHRGTNALGNGAKQHTAPTDWSKEQMRDVGNLD